MAGEDGEGTVDLFGQHNARKLVRQCNAAKGEHKARSCARFFRPAVGRTDGKDDPLRTGVPQTANSGSQLF